MLLKHINNIDALSVQIEALLDLMQCSERSVDHQSIKTASEMCVTLHDELMEEIKAIEKELKQGDDLK